MNNNLHELVKDLFPNYIEKLTSDETNKFIEEHISSCKECKETLDKMRVTMKEENHTDLKDKKVKFAKKVNRRLKLSKLFILLIIIAILVCIGNYFRKVMILNNLKNLEWKYEKSSNYMIEECFTEQLGGPDNLIDYDTCYFKDGKFLRISESINKNNVDENLLKERTIIKDYEMNDKLYIFEYRNNKLLGVEISSIDNGEVETYSDLPTFKYYYSIERYLSNIYKGALTRKITTEKFDGIDCYKIETYDHDEVLYFEKTTGLLRKSSAFEYYYYFDCVEDNVFKLPEIPEGTRVTDDGIVQTGGDIYEE